MSKPSESHNSNKKSPELARLLRLKALLNTEIKVVGKTYYIYRAGVWQAHERDLMRPLALKVMDEEDQTSHNVNGILDLAETKWQVPHGTFKGCAAFDLQGAILLNTLDGVLSITAEGVTELPHAPEYFFTRQLQVVYDRGAKYSDFDRILGESLPCAEDRRLKQLCMANIFYPTARLEICLVEIGASGSGKSTLAEPFLQMFDGGTDMQMVSHIPITQLCDNKTYALGEFEYSLVNLATELQSLEVADSSNFKTLVSGEPMLVRNIYERPRRIRTSTKLWFLSNSMPRFKQGTDAEWRRMRFLHYTNVVSPARYDSTLKAKLTAEKSGIFSNWVIPALVDLIKMENMPIGGNSALTLRDRFSLSNDPLAAFARTRCVFEKEAFTPTHQLINALRFYYEDNDFPEGLGKHPLKPFLERYPQTKLVRMRKYDQVRGVLGVRLKEDPIDG